MCLFACLFVCSFPAPSAQGFGQCDLRIPSSLTLFGACCAISHSGVCCAIFHSGVCIETPSPAGGPWQLTEVRDAQGHAYLHDAHTGIVYSYAGPEDWPQVGFSRDGHAPLAIFVFKHGLLTFGLIILPAVFHTMPGRRSMQPLQGSILCICCFQWLKRVRTG